MKRTLTKKSILACVLGVVLACAMLIACNNGGTPAPKTVNVNFVMEDGTFLAAVVVDYNTVPTYTGATPEKAQTEAEVYEFAGWTAAGVLHESLPAVTKNTVFTATFSSAPRKYAITFVVDGETSVQQVAYGETPSYAGESTFDKNGVLYEITGWDKTFAPVSGEATYTAVIDRATSVTVTFVVAGERLELPTQLGAVPSFYGTPYREADTGRTYVFAGWECGTEFYPAGTALPAVTDSVTYTARFDTRYKKVSVTYLNGEKTVDTVEVDYGSHPPMVVDGVVGRAPTEQYEYEFVGWRLYGTTYMDMLPIVTEDVTVSAIYEPVPRTYTLTVEYVEEGSTVATYSQPYAYGDSYYVESPDRAGKVATTPYVKGVLTKNEQLTVTYVNATVWDGTSAVWSKGTGEENDPYLIENPSHLAYLATSVDGGNAYAGKHFRLTADLDLDGRLWTTIGNNTQPFSGTFDGDGHLIKGLFVNDTRANTVANSGHGLFSTVNGTVKGLTVDGVVRSVARYTAIIVGNLTAGGKVTDCTSFGSVYGYGNNGGVVGLSVGEISDCVNYATVCDDGVSGAYRFGGVVGTQSGKPITDCVNYGTIAPGIGGEAGGVIGRLEGESSVTDCVNYGYVNCTAGNNIGGVVGYDVGSGTHRRLVNHAPVYGVDWVAGIIGSFTNAASYLDCTNYGYISGATRVAGIAGRAGISATTGLGLLQDAVNYGEVYSTGANCAGVAAVSYGTLTDCVNHATVRSLGTSVGGIVGTHQINTKDVAETWVSGCINYGDVISNTTATNAVLGGIAGRTDLKTISDKQYHTQFVDCINYGDVVALNGGSYTGGIVGACNGGYFNKCINNGTVLAANGSYVAGIAGSNYGYGKVWGCTNYGAIRGGATVGQICGQLTNTSKATGNAERGKLI